MRMMARESPYFREVVAELFEKFGKENLNVKEYSNYLGKDPSTVATAIRKGQLPGKAIGGEKKPEYIIPIKSIALYEIKVVPER